MKVFSTSRAQSALPSSPSHPRKSRTDVAEALAAVYDNKACHLNLQAYSVRRRRTMGICLALRELAQKTPGCSRPTSPNEFGVLFFVGQPRSPHRRRAPSCVLNHRNAGLTPACRLQTARHRTEAVRQRRSQVCASHSGSERPSPCRGPSCSSPLLLSLRGTSWRHHSRQRSLSSPPPPSHALRGGGHESREDGHTCKCVWTYAKGDGDGEGATCGRNGDQSV